LVSPGVAHPLQELGEFSDAALMGGDLLVRALRRVMRVLDWAFPPNRVLRIGLFLASLWGIMVAAFYFPAQNGTVTTASGYTRNPAHDHLIVAVVYATLLLALAVAVATWLWHRNYR
jgi:hypothetical protein